MEKPLFLEVGRGGSDAFFFNFNERVRKKAGSADLWTPTLLSKEQEREELKNPLCCFILELKIKFEKALLLLDFLNERNEFPGDKKDLGKPKQCFFTFGEQDILLRSFRCCEIFSSDLDDKSLVEVKE